MNIKSVILESLSDIGTNYVESKSRTLEGLTDLEAMEWAMINVDGVRQQWMCSKMGVNFLNWRNTARVIRRVKGLDQIDEKKTPKEVAFILAWQNDESVHVTQDLDDKSFFQLAEQVRFAKNFQLYRLNVSDDTKAQISLEIAALDDAVANL